MRGMWKFGFLQVPWGSAGFRLVVEAVVSRIPLIYLQATKEEDSEKRKAGNLEKGTKIAETSAGYVEICLPSAFAGFRQPPPASAWSPRRWFRVFL